MITTTAKSYRAASALSRSATIHKCLDRSVRVDDEVAAGLVEGEDVVPPRNKAARESRMMSLIGLSDDDDEDALSRDSRSAGIT